MSFLRKLTCFVMFCAAALGCTTAHAGHENVITSLAGTLNKPITVTPSNVFGLSVDNQVHPYVQNSVFRIPSAKAAVVLRYDETKRNHFSSPWSITITYDLVTDAQTYSNQVITINYDPALSYTDKSVMEFVNVNKASLHVSDIAVTVNSTTTHYTTLPSAYSDVYLDLELDIERYYFLTASPNVHYPSTTITNNKLALAWDYIPGAESYDLEWLFIDIGSAPFSNTFDFDFRNATRINTPFNYYDISLAYPRGIILFRVRGVGVDPTDLQVKVEGPWNMTVDKGNTTQVPANFAANYYRYEHNGLDDDMNWQYSAVFAEDGKRKEVIAYFDGSLRNRQSVTEISTDNSVVIGETKYDYEGRPAVSVMPSPMTSSGLKFYNNFNPNFDKTQFDTDATLGNAFAMSGLSGAGQYYSSGSPDQTGVNAYIPDAGGYPFAQTRYMPDGTGRIMSQGGVGPEFQLSSSSSPKHDIKYFYGTPSTQTELDRLFGNEVGLVSRYKKNFIVDPNGQISVQYLDQEGRVIATALAGNPPSNLLSIEPQPQSTTISGSLLGNNQLTQNNEMVSTTTLMVTVPGVTYTFNYSLAAECPTLSCLTLCQTCKYELEIKVTDSDGNAVAVAPSNTQLSYDDISSASVSFTVTFNDIGAYTVTKILKIDQENITNVLTPFFTANQACVTMGTPQSDCAASDCNTVCEEMFRRENTDGSYTYIDGSGSSLDAGGNPYDINDYNSFVASCKQECPTTTPSVQAPDECTIKKNQMLADMSPGGQYFDNTPFQYERDPNTYALILDNNGSPIPNANYYSTDINAWLTSNLNNNLWIDEINDFPNPNTHSFTTWDEVRANWDPAWADILLKYHPEYCAYQYYCVDLYDKCLKGAEDGNAFMEQMYSFDDDASASSGNTNFFNPTGLTSPPMTSTYNVSPIADHKNYLPTYASYSSTPSSSYLDPYFECISLDKAKMNGFLQEFMPVNGSTTDFYSLWYLIEDPHNMALVHGGLNRTGVDASVLAFLDNLHGTTTTDGVIGTHSYQVTKYQYFRSVYKYYRDYLIYQGFTTIYLSSHTCSQDDFLASPDDNGLTNQGYQIRWPVNPVFENYDPSNPSATTNLDNYNSSTQSSNCTSICSSYADQWMAELGSCIDVDDQSHVKELLIAICAGGCDGDNPEGQDSSTDGVWDPGKGQQFYSFSDVTNAYGTDCPTVVHPEQYSQGECDCENFSSFLAANSLTYTSGSTAIFDALDDAFGGGDPLGFTSTDVSTWVTLCQQSTPPSHSALTNFPSDLSCGTDGNSEITGVSNPTQSYIDNCNETSLGLSTYTLQNNFNQELSNQQNAVLGSYRSQCMNTLEGREVFTVSYPLLEYYYTLYYYDQAGNLVKTVSPERVDILDATEVQIVEAHRSNSASPVKYPDHKSVTKYRHNSLQNVVEQKVVLNDESMGPIETRTTYYYDYLGRIVASQSERQKNFKNASSVVEPQYSYVIYDNLGRPEEAGQLGNVTALTQATASDPALLTAWRNSAGYKEQVTKTYYDEAVVGIPAGVTQSHLRNRVATVTYQASGSSAGYDNATHYSYDIHGNVSTLYQENLHEYLADIGQSLKVMKYDYDVISGNMNEVHYQSGSWDQFHHRYLYDADNRLTHAFSSRNGRIWEKEAKYFYYKHGPLARVEMGDKQVQAMDYAYTLQGWIKGVNSNTLRSNRDIGKDGWSSSTANLNDFFAPDVTGYTLGYFTGDYTPVKSSLVSSGYTEFFEAKVANSGLEAYAYNLYNGNISHMVTAITDQNENPLTVMGSAYHYDQLNRLRDAVRYTNLDAGLNEWTNSINPNLNKYSESLHYDMNGNITSMLRYGNAAGSDVQMDNLAYSYTANSDRLNYVDDNATATSGAYGTDIDPGQANNNYGYDDNGNLIKDVQEGIDPSVAGAGIFWNVSGKVLKVVRSSGSASNLEFGYDAMGNRIMKIEQKRPSGVLDTQKDWKYTYYVRDAQGNVMATYSRSYAGSGTSYTDNFSVQEFPVYGNSRLGVRAGTDIGVQATSFTSTIGTNPGDAFGSRSYSSNPSPPACTNCSYSRTLGYKSYELSNHLGNVLNVVSDRKLSVDAYTYTAAPNGNYIYMPSSGTYSAVTAGTGTYNQSAGADGKAESYKADVMSYTDYYSFGMLMPGRNGNSGDYRYGFNGMEKDDEMKGSGNSYTTDFRMYDPRLGRWFSVDPYSYAQPGWSPYKAFYDNPIYWIDPTGGCEDCEEIKDPSGEQHFIDDGATVSVDKKFITGRDGKTYVWVDDKVGYVDETMLGPEYKTSFEFSFTMASTKVFNSGSDKINSSIGEWNHNYKTIAENQKYYIWMSDDVGIRRIGVKGSMGWGAGTMYLSPLNDPGQFLANATYYISDGSVPLWRGIQGYAANVMAFNPDGTLLFEGYLIGVSGGGTMDSEADKVMDKIPVPFKSDGSPKIIKPKMRVVNASEVWRSGTALNLSDTLRISSQRSGMDSISNANGIFTAEERDSAIEASPPFRLYRTTPVQKYYPTK